MDQKRLAQLGRRQTWLSAQIAEGFTYTPPSQIIGRILLHIREACDEAKETYLPTEILVILYGFGNPAIGCHMDCTKDLLEPDAMITPTKILNELPPGRDVTLAMRVFTTKHWVHAYRLHRMQLDKVKTAHLDVYKQAGEDGTLIKQNFTEEGASVYRHSNAPQILSAQRHYELALWFREGLEEDKDGSPKFKRILQFMDPYPREKGVKCLARVASLAMVVNFRLSMAFLTDNMVAHFNLKRPMQQTCLEWMMFRWLERQDNLTRSDGYSNLFKDLMDIENGAEPPCSGYTRFYLYLRAAHHETYLAEEEVGTHTVEHIDSVLEEIDLVFDYVLDKVQEKILDPCGETIENAKKQYGNPAEGDLSQHVSLWPEGLKRTMQALCDLIYDQCPVGHIQEE
ncbi:hypothetical protein FPRO04_00666 [Fusarium proliferatum]|nr:hypothetical protein FPRO03_00335 [Fusarium proliferatum]KAG4287123.1 hypothetical protein FPRO04_00666 [Fusarium proliferatum]